MFKRNIFAAIVCSVLIVGFANTQAQQIQTQNKLLQSLNLQEAIRIGINNSFNLKITKKKIDALTKNVEGRGRIPNPSIDASFDDVLGTGTYEPFDLTESVLTFSQTISLTGKLSTENEIGYNEIKLYNSEYLIELNSFIHSIKQSYLDVSVFQQQISLYKKLDDISKLLVENIQKRVDAGKLSVNDVLRAKLQKKYNDINLRNAKVSYENALVNLFSLLNIDISDYEFISSVKQNENVVQYNLQDLISTLPNIAIADKNNEIKKLKITNARQNKTPDLTISTGIKRINETDDYTMNIGVGMELPIFNNYQSEVDEAIIEEEISGIKKRNLIREFKQNYSLVMNQLEYYNNTINDIKNVLLPDAELVYENIKKGNLEGRFTILEVLEAQKVLFETEQQLLEFLYQYNIELNNLDAIMFSEIKGSEL